MVFIIITIISFIVLRLSTGWRMKTLFWMSLVIGLAADFGTDLLVMLRR